MTANKDFKQVDVNSVKTGGPTETVITTTHELTAGVENLENQILINNKL